MKYTLVCKNEPREAGYRAADVYDIIPWEAAPDHMWVECPDDYVADTKWFDPTDNTLKDYPKIDDSAPPKTIGVQTL